MVREDFSNDTFSSLDAGTCGSLMRLMSQTANRFGHAAPTVDESGTSPPYVASEENDVLKATLKVPCLSVIRIDIVGSQAKGVLRS